MAVSWTTADPSCNLVLMMPLIPVSKAWRIKREERYDVAVTPCVVYSARNSKNPFLCTSGGLSNSGVGGAVTVAVGIEVGEAEVGAPDCVGCIVTGATDVGALDVGARDVGDNVGDMV